MFKTLLTIFILLITLLNTSFAQEKNFLDVPYIEVTGKAEQFVVPDQIYLSIIINEQENKRKNTLSKAEKEMISALEKIGINTKQNLSVKDAASNFKQYILRGTDVVTSKTYQLIVNNAQTAGQVILTLERIEISNVNIEKVSHSKLTELRNQVKAQAAANAQANAISLAAAVKQSIGRALHIQEIDYGYTENQPYRMLAKASSQNENDAVPELEFEKIKLSSQINAKFELKEIVK